LPLRLLRYCQERRSHRHYALENNMNSPRH
jgi:hypothetical protein